MAYRWGLSWKEIWAPPQFLGTPLYLLQAYLTHLVKHAMFTFAFVETDLNHSVGTLKQQTFAIKFIQLT